MISVKVVRDESILTSYVHCPALCSTELCVYLLL